MGLDDEPMAEAVSLIRGDVTQGIMSERSATALPARVTMSPVPYAWRAPGAVAPAAGSAAAT